MRRRTTGYLGPRFQTFVFDRQIPKSCWQSTAGDYIVWSVSDHYRASKLLILGYQTPSFSTFLGPYPLGFTEYDA